MTESTPINLSDLRCLELACEAAEEIERLRARLRDDVLAERARIVAWLREEAEDSWEDRYALARVADAIEREEPEEIDRD